MGHVSGSKSRPNPSASVASLIRGDMVVRATVIAFIMGSVLTLINQPGAVLRTKPFATLSLVLVYLTPFVVVLVSQILGARQARLDAATGGPCHAIGKSVWQTALSHGIPVRAPLIGLVVAMLNASVVVAVSSLESAADPDIPLALNSQTFVLATLFSFLSQAFAYQRAAQLFRP